MSRPVVSGIGMNDANGQGKEADDEERPLQTYRGVLMFSQSLNSAALHRPRGYDEIPAVIRTELNVHRDRDMIVRMQDLAHKKRMRHPDITDDEMADYLALAENFQNFEQWISTRRSSSQTTAPARIRSAMVIAVAIGLLAATLILGIAITV